MARIKVTGYIDTEDIKTDHPEEDFIDLEDGTGLSTDGYMHYENSLPLDDVAFELVDEGDDQ